MFYFDEEHFDENLKRFYEEFTHILAFATYNNTGWAKINVPWRRLCPRFDKG